MAITCIIDASFSDAKTPLPLSGGGVFRFAATSDCQKECILLFLLGKKDDDADSKNDAQGKKNSHCHTSETKR